MDLNIKDLSESYGFKVFDQIFDFLKNSRRHSYVNLIRESSSYKFRHSCALEVGLSIL